MGPPIVCDTCAVRKNFAMAQTLHRRQEVNVEFTYSDQKNDLKRRCSKAVNNSLSRACVSNELRSEISGALQGVGWSVVIRQGADYVSSSRNSATKGYTTREALVPTQKASRIPSHLAFIGRYRPALKGGALISGRAHVVAWGSWQVGLIRTRGQGERRLLRQRGGRREFRS